MIESRRHIKEETPLSENRKNRISSYRKEMIGHSFDSPVVTLLMLIMSLPFLTIITENTIPEALFNKLDKNSPASIGGGMNSSFSSVG